MVEAAISRARSAPSGRVHVVWTCGGGGGGGGESKGGGVGGGGEQLDGLPLPLTPRRLASFARGKSFATGWAPSETLPRQFPDTS